MLNLMRRTCEQLAPFAAPLLLVAALAEFAVTRVLAFLRRIDVGESWQGLTSFQHATGPFFANVLLLSAGLALVLLLPGFVKGSRERHSFLFRVLAIGTLLLLGLSVIRTALRGNNLLWAQDVLLIIGALLTTWLIARGKAPTPERRLAAIIVPATMVAQLWRFLFDVSQSEIPEGGTLDALRQAGDALVITACGTLPLFLLFRRDLKSLLLALPFALPAAWLFSTQFEEMRQVLAPATGLWLTSLPDFLVGLFSVLGILGAAGLVIHVLRKGRGASLTLGMLLLFLAGFLSVESRHFLALWAGLLILARWSEGEGESPREVPQLFT